MTLKERLGQLVDEMVARGIRYEDARHEFEKTYIARVLDGADGNLGQAAVRLGIHRNTLSRKLAEYHRRHH